MACEIILTSGSGWCKWTTLRSSGNRDISCLIAWGAYMELIDKDGRKYKTYCPTTYPEYQHCNPSHSDQKRRDSSWSRMQYMARPQWFARRKERKGKEGNQGSVRCYFCVPDQGIRFVGVQSSGGCYNRVLLRMIPDNTFSYYYYICKLKVISYNPMSRTCRSGSINWNEFAGYETREHIYIDT